MMRKIIYTIGLIVFFAIGFAASDADDTAFEDKETQDKFLDQVTGTYVVTDEDGVVYTFYINRDKTMRASASGNIFYGSWRKVNGRVNFKFGSRDANELPRIAFKSEMSLWIDNDYFISEDGFLYGGGSFQPDKHNPDYRLKYKKLN